MSQLRVNSIANTAGVSSITNNSLGVNPTTAIALHAKRTGNASGINDGQYIKWNNIIVSSPYYNSSTGLFTAPIAGKYFVSAHVISNTTTDAYLYLYKNGVSQSYGHVNMSGSWAHVTVTGIVSCSVNDTFGVGAKGTNTYYGDDHNGYTVYYLGA